MRDLIKQEQFELEALDRLNSGKFLKSLIFCGGTMLRLCYGLNRFSVDLDFWVAERINEKELFSGLKTYLSRFYTITDSMNKYSTLLFELKSKDYPRRLKLEIRKEKKAVKTAQTIAYSKYSNIQVLIRAADLEDMMSAKIEAFLERKEIRDIFDLEFLCKKGVSINASPENLKKLISGIGRLNKKDYTVKLGSLLEAGERQYYSKENFKILKAAINYPL